MSIWGKGQRMKLSDERPEDEVIDNALLRAVLNRQLDVSERVPALARALYEARAVWVMSTMTWEELGPVKQAEYRAEVCQLITGPQTAPESLPDATGDSRDLDGLTLSEKENA